MQRNPIILFASILLCCAAASAQEFGRNLIVNPGAEDGPAQVSTQPVPSIPGWSRKSGNVTVVPYGGADDDNVKVSDPGPETRGRQYFTGGYASNLGTENDLFFLCTITQTIRLEKLTPSIDTGKATFVLSGWFGALTFLNDTAELKIHFLDASGRELSTASAGKVQAVDRQEKPMLLRREQTGSVPVGTRSVEVELIMRQDRSIVFSSDNEASADELSLVLFGEAPTVANNGVVNAASYGYGAVTPGELVTLFGGALGPATTALATVQNGRFPTEIGGTRVMFDGTAAPLVYTSNGQVAAIVPFTVAGRANTSVVVETPTGRSAAQTLPIAASAPALFTANASGKGPGALLNQDASVNTAGNPAERGSIVVLYGTGAGPMSPMPVDGAIIVDGNTRFVANTSVTIGGQPAEVLYAGGAPYLVGGVFQINVRVPNGIAPGNAVPVLVQIGDKSSQAGVTLAVK